MPESATDRLVLLEQEVIAHLFVLRPTTAAYLGLHDYDGLLPDLSVEGTDRWIATAKEFLAQVEAIPDADLPPGRRLDRDLLRLQLEGNLFDLEETRELDRNPMSYLFQPDLTNYVSRDYAPIPVRVSAIVRILTSVPGLMEGAKRRLEPHLPKPFVTLSIQIAQGLPAHFAEGETFARTGSEELGEQVRKAREGADAAVLAFATWLEEERLPHATEEFALGRERFQRLLWVREGLTMSVDEVLRRGREDLKRNRERLAEIAHREKVSIDELIRRLYDNHPAASELLPLTQRLTDEVREFVRTNQMVTIPEPEVVHVRETPSWARDLWTAAMSPPGPFEKPVDGIYWITSVDPKWNEQQSDGWMRTLNHAMLKNTTVHEVWPGHYLQSLHFHRTEQSLARKVWFSYSFIEGWAHYCEQAALEAGFDNHSTPAEVTQLHDALLRDCRL
ncbi:MAG TPA: DUF885 domain-containing protein, partial [Thermoplasmata archaeon]|nr:DUF885 domain-containing protein [Thermoplasmata archaeon]